MHSSSSKKSKRSKRRKVQILRHSQFTSKVELLVTLRSGRAGEAAVQRSVAPWSVQFTSSSRYDLLTFLFDRSCNKMTGGEEGVRGRSFGVHWQRKGQGRKGRLR